MIKGERDFQHYLKLDDMALTPSGVPILKGITMKKGKLDLLPFNYASNFPKNERKDKVVHFFLADYLFERCWNQLEKQAELLKQFKAVLQPDFSMYTDMPKPMQQWQHYRKMFVSAYWQSKGIRVIPTPGWSTPDSYEWCFEGMPTGSMVVVSSVGCSKNPEAKKLFELGYREMLKRLEPAQIVWYGKVPEWLEEKPIAVFENSSQTRFTTAKIKKQTDELLLGAGIPKVERRLLHG